MRGTRTRAARWGLIAFLGFVGGFMFAAEPAPPAAGDKAELKTIADWWFNLYGARTNQRIGGEHVVTQQQQDEKTAGMVVQDTLAQAQKDTSVGYTATVRYSLKPVLAVTSGEVTTNIGGKRYLQGSFALNKRQLTTTSSLTDADGTAIKPEHTDKTDLPQGLVLARQGLEVLAPALLPKQGRRDGIVLIEFPAQLDTLLTADGGFSLTRTDRSDGTALFQLQQGAADPIWQYVLNKDRSIHDGRFYETRFVPATKEEATKPVTGP